jgi:hypothetical protein
MKRRGGGEERMYGSVATNNCTISYIFQLIFENMLSSVFSVSSNEF